MGSALARWSYWPRTIQQGMSTNQLLMETVRIHFRLWRSTFSRPNHIFTLHKPQLSVEPTPRSTLAKLKFWPLATKTLVSAPGFEAKRPVSFSPPDPPLSGDSCPPATPGRSAKTVAGCVPHLSMRNGSRGRVQGVAGLARPPQHLHQSSVAYREVGGGPRWCLAL